MTDSSAVVTGGASGLGLATATALIERGVDPARLTSVGWGESRPVADNGTEGGRVLNRRTELVVVGKD